MRLPTPTESQRRELATALAPPPALRARLLARHAGRRRRRTAILLAAPVLAGLGLLLAAGRGAPEPVAGWRQSAALEARWRAEADFQWLRRDARARHLVDELRRLDAALAAGPDAPHAEALWRERSRMLADLIASRRDGRTAVLM